MVDRPYSLLSSVVVPEQMRASSNALVSLDQFTEKVLIPDMKRGIEEGRTQVITVFGDPGSGKSTMLAALGVIIGDLIGPLGRILDKPLIHRALGFDDYRDRYRQLHKSTARPSGTVSTKKDFRGMSDLMRDGVTETIMSGVNVVTIESPFTYMLRLGGRWQGVDIGTTPVVQLYNQHLLNASLRKLGIQGDFPNCDLYFISCTADETLGDAGTKWRYTVKGAQDEQSVRQALFDYPQPRFGDAIEAMSDEELMRIPRIGAKVSTMDMMRLWRMVFFQGRGSEELLRRIPYPLGATTEYKARLYEQITNKAVRPMQDIIEDMVRSGYVPTDALSFVKIGDFTIEMFRSLTIANYLRLDVLNKDNGIEPRRVFVGVTKPELRDIYRFAA